MLSKFSTSKFAFGLAAKQGIDLLANGHQQSVAGPFLVRLCRAMHTASSGAPAEPPKNPQVTLNRTFRSHYQNNGPRVLITGSFGQLGSGLAAMMRFVKQHPLQVP